MVVSTELVTLLYIIYWDVFCVVVSIIPYLSSEMIVIVIRFKSQPKGILNMFSLRTHKYTPAKLKDLCISRVAAKFTSSSLP